MPLPVMPTSYAVAFLLLDARKYTESGVYVLERAGLQLFAWQLSEKVMVAYDALVLNPTFMYLHVSEKAKSDPGHEKRVVSVLSQLQSCLDPIDWAMWEPNLTKEHQSWGQFSVIALWDVSRTSLQEPYPHSVIHCQFGQAGLSSPAQAKSPNLFCAESHTMNSWKGRDLPAKGVWQGFIPKEARPPGSSFCSSFILYTKGLPLDVVKNCKISKGFITTLEIE
ncbi:unnamed protein product [Sphagnum balticum]